MPPLARWVVSLLVAALATFAARAEFVAPRVHPGTPAPAAEDTAFRVPRSSFAPELRLEAPGAPEVLKSGGDKAGPPNQIGVSRRDALATLDAEALRPEWVRVAGGHVLVLRVRSVGAKRLRVGLRIPTLLEGLEIRVAGTREADRHLLSASWLRETYGAHPGLIWTPATEGEAQDIEIFVPHGVPPERGTVAVENVSHLFVDPFAAAPGAEQAAFKLLGCHSNYTCGTDSAIRSAGSAVARMVITHAGGNSSFCSGALINDTGDVKRYFSSAFHCIGTASEAASLQLNWGYEQGCGTGALAPGGSTSLGAQLLRADSRNDFSLVRLTGAIPAGVTLLGWNSAPVPTGTAVYGIHHPAGVPKAVSIGNVSGRKTTSALLPSGEVLTVNANAIAWHSGITEQGSSGSPLLSGAGVLRGTLSMVPRAQSCGAARIGYYSDFALVYPLVREWLNPVAATADDFPNDAAGASTRTAYDNAFLKVSLDSATDEDWLRFVLPERGTWILLTTAEPGAAQVDTVGRIYAADGATLLAENDNDPLGAFGVNFAFYLTVEQPGTFYLRITGGNGARGRFELISLYDTADDHSDIPFLGTAIAPHQSVAGVIETGGDGDYFVLDLPAGTITLRSSGATDVVGVLRDASLQALAVSDDASPGDRNFSITRHVPAGRYYLQVVGYDVDVTGSYTVHAEAASAAAANYTALWYNRNEPGWGVNTNHQGDLLFATLFTYDIDGGPLWLVASELRRQANGAYTGALYRTSGPPYYAVPFTGVTLGQVGTMTFTFASESSGTLVYTYRGATVTKSIERQAFAARVPTCTSGSTSRASATNYQDLWWNPGEPGWGINFTHQSDILFATLFTYNNSRRDVWLVASELRRQPDGAFSGDLYVTSGPPFDASPWRAVAVENVGRMTVRFGSGERGTLTYTVLGTTVTKSIERQVFGTAPPTCR